MTNETKPAKKKKVPYCSSGTLKKLFDEYFELKILNPNDLENFLGTIDRNKKDNKKNEKYKSELVKLTKSDDLKKAFFDRIEAEKSLSDSEKRERMRKALPIRNEIISRIVGRPLGTEGKNLGIPEKLMRCPSINHYIDKEDYYQESMEMWSIAAEKIIECVDLYNPLFGTCPFSYFTSVIKNEFFAFFRQQFKKRKTEYSIIDEFIEDPAE